VHASTEAFGVGCYRFFTALMGGGGEPLTRAEVAAADVFVRLLRK
jgi:hypothetical protein